VHGGGGGGVHGDSNLGIVNAGEVAGTSGLVLLRLESEGVGVHTSVRVAGVVVEGLHLVEVLALLLLEAVLAVKHKLEGREGTGVLLGESLGGVLVTSGVHGGAGGTASHEGVGVVHDALVVGEDDLGVKVLGGEVPKRGLGGGVGEAPHELLNGVVVGEADLLGGGGVDGVVTGVLDLLDEVLVTLLGEAAALLGVEVHVVGPHLEDGGVDEGVEVGGEVDVDADLVVLESNEGEVETGVAVEEEDEGEVDGLTVTGSGHLTPVSLLGLIEVELGVEAPPLLVVLVDALTTDRQLDIGHGTLGSPDT